MKRSPAQIKASTQGHLDIQEIIDDLVVLKNGNCCLVLQTTTINFGLLSEAEQDAIIYAYASFLNSLSFPVQILVRSQKKDVTGYIKALAKREAMARSEIIKKRINTYRRFVEYIVRENEVLDKNFFLIIPFSPLEAGVSSKSFIGSSQTLSNKDRSWLLEKAKNSLIPKRDHLSRQFSRLGLKAKHLNTEELVRLFFNIYNPEVEGQTLLGPQEYQTLIVRANVAETSADNHAPD